MAISFRKYIDIVSGVGGSSAVRLRDLIGRLFTTNNLLPAQSFIEFTTADQVAEYFGSASDEYKRALFYFSWISPLITRAKKISFARWVDTAIAPRIYGEKGSQSVASWTPITTGAFSLTMGEDTFSLTSMDFSGAASLADVATVIQTKIRAQTGGGALWTTATVSWDATRQSFNLIGGTTGAADISVEAGSGGSDIAEQLGWLSPINTILAPGSDVETITQTLNASADASNNFGSFLFMAALTDDEVLEAAEWNAAQNVSFQFMVPVLANDVADISGLLVDLAGAAITLAPLSTEYPEMCPMITLAATDYSKRNSVMNYMFKRFDLTPSVTTTTNSDSYDALRVNYYGRTQQAGQYIDFYQRGVLTGLATDPVDQNVYANEQWLKDAAGVSIMDLLLSLARVSANSKGRSQLINALQGVIDQALFNGTISVGKPLTTTQKLYITEITGDELAWQQVQNIGYWLDCVMVPYETEDNRTEWKAVYTLVYSKDDAIRKVDGTHILI